MRQIPTLCITTKHHSSLQIEKILPSLTFAKTTENTDQNEVRNKHSTFYLIESTQQFDTENLHRVDSILS